MATRKSSAVEGTSHYASIRKNSPEMQLLLDGRRKKANGRPSHPDRIEKRGRSPSRPISFPFYAHPVPVSFSNYHDIDRLLETGRLSNKDGSRLDHHKDFTFTCSLFARLAVKLLLLEPISCFLFIFKKKYFKNKKSCWKFDPGWNECPWLFPLI